MSAEAVIEEAKSLLNAFGLPDFPRVYAGRREFTRTSATQVESFISCNRSWFFGWPLRLKKPPTASMKFGVVLHAEEEAYFRFQKNADELSKLAQMGLPHLPERGAGLLIEEHLGTPIKPLWPHTDRQGLGDPVEVLGLKEERLPLLAAGIPFYGFIDLLDPRRMPERLLVVDHKTTSDLKYMKTPEQLRRSVQMVSYAWNALQRFGAPSSGEIDIRHVYYRTKGAACAVPVNTSIEVAELPALWDGIVRVTEKMKVVGRAEKVEDVEPNYRACGDYGGCPHAAYCPGNTPEKRFSMSLSEMLSNPSQGVPAAQTPPPPPPPPQQEIVPDSKILAARQAVATFTTMPDEVKATARLLTTEERQAELEKLRIENEATQKRVQEQLKAEAAAKASQGAVATNGKVTMREEGTALQSVGQVLPPDAPKEGAPPPTVAAATAEAPKAKRKYTRKAPPAAGAAPSASAAPAGAGFMLLIDCLPMGSRENVVVLEEVIEEIGGKISEQLNVPHVLTLEFGKWKGYLVAAMIAPESLDTYATDGAIICARTSETSSEVIAALVPKAAVVIRGTR